MKGMSIQNLQASKINGFLWVFVMVLICKPFQKTNTIVISFSKSSPVFIENGFFISAESKVVLMATWNGQ